MTEDRARVAGLRPRLHRTVRVGVAAALYPIRRATAQADIRPTRNALLCTELFIASDGALPSPPTASTALHVYECTDSDDPIRALLGQREIRKLGSYQRCACGFFREAPDALTSEAAAVEGSRLALAEYARLAATHGVIDLYVCDRGEQHPPISRRVEFSPDELLADDDWLELGTVVRIRAAGHLPASESGHSAS